MEKWWGYLDEDEQRELEKKYPGFKKIETPSIEIRWELDDMTERKLNKQGKSGNAYFGLTEEEIAEDIAFNKAYKEKYGVRYKDPPISEIDKQRDKEFREEYNKQKKKN